jgi:hypothetical protein
MTAFRDLTGQKFGRLTVLSRAPNDKRGKVHWHCMCEDGNLVDVGRAELISGDTKSCGCLHRELTVQRDRERAKHGHCRQHRVTPEYKAWRSMKDRCLNPNHPKFKDWGGRGITIYPPWIDDFEAFFAYMGPKPSPQHSIDRWPDRDGNYVPGNVRWATPREQQNNRRDNVIVQLPDGRDVTRTQLSRELGLPDRKLKTFVNDAERSIARGATAPTEQATRVGIQITLWMLLADMLRGHPDPPQAARDFARLVRGKAEDVAVAHDRRPAPGGGADDRS